MEQRIPWYRTPIDKTELSDLTRRSDLRGLLYAGSFLLVYLCTAFLCFFLFRRGLWIPMVAACYLHAMFSSFIGMEAAVHELSHGTPFKSKWLNEIFYRLFCFLSWNNYLHFRVSHMKHHQFTVHEGLDKEVIILPISFTLADYLSWFTFDYKKFWKIMRPNILHIFGKADVDFFFWDPLFPEGDKRRRKMCNWARFVMVGHLILLGLFIYFELWVLIFVVTSSYFFATFLGHGCGMQQHLGLTPNVADWRVSCHTVKFDPITAYLYWQMNYHIEHHMFAAVPFYNLKRLHRKVAYDYPEPVKGYLAGVGRILAIKKRQQAEPGYSFVPEFPDTAAAPNLPT